MRYLSEQGSHGAQAEGYDGTRQGNSLKRFRLAGPGHAMGTFRQGVLCSAAVM